LPCQRPAACRTSPRGELARNRPGRPVTITAGLPVQNAPGDVAMPSGGSVSRLIDGLVVGDAAAVQALWERYFRRLVGLARKKLQSAPRRLEDEEDVALSAFASFCRAAEAGRFPQLLDREGLWRLLVVITVRKVAHLVRDEGRRPTSPLDAVELLSHEPSPAVAAAAVDEHRRLLD